MSSMTIICRIVATLTILIVGQAQAGAQSDEPADETRLFVKLAQEATLADGILTLHDVDGSVLWFTDRPFRDSGSMDIADLIESWGEGDDNFADNPPNAVLSGMSSKDGEVAIVVVLMAPRYENNALSFRFAAISEVLPSRLSNVALMIDDDIIITPPPVLPDGG